MHTLTNSEISGIVISMEKPQSIGGKVMPLNYVTGQYPRICEIQIYVNFAEKLFWWKIGKLRKY